MFVEKNGKMPDGNRLETASSAQRTAITMSKALEVLGGAASRKSKYPKSLLLGFLGSRFPPITRSVWIVLGRMVTPHEGRFQ